MRFLKSIMLGLALFSLLASARTTHATQWVGSDDGEFDRCNGCGQSYVGLRQNLNGEMLWTSNNNQLSMQYNPDHDASLYSQYGSDWFQTGVVADTHGCSTFTIQVYYIGWELWRQGELDYRTDWPVPWCNNGIYQSGAVWDIREDLVSTGDSHFRDVYFSISGGGSSYTYTFNAGDLQRWLWLRSNLCWCGTGGPNGVATFSRAWGTSTSYSNINMIPVDPPST